MRSHLSIALETGNFVAKKRTPTFYVAVAKHFKDITGWYVGCDIHHIDFNPCNNHPSNLCCLSHSDHLKLHKNRLGKKMSDSTKEKLSVALTGLLKGRTSPMKGKSRREESNKKTSESIKQWWAERKLKNL